MKKAFIVLSLIVTSVLFFSCDEFFPNNKEKITEYEKTIEKLNSQIVLLQTENDDFKKEIEAYKLTDQYFYQAGVDEFLNEKYWEALEWMGKLKVKFPTSPLLVYANKIIEDSKYRIDKLPSRYIVFEGEESTSPPVKYYYIPGVGDIPQKISIIEPLRPPPRSR